MTYGWVLCTQAGKRLVKGHGSCPGRPNSLRGEACGMLLATLFTTLLKHYFQCTLTSTLLSYQSDNLELIKRQRDHQHYTHPYPNTTLKAEFDLTKMIHVLHREHELPSSFCHVKGHQDRDTAYSNLDLNAQLNVGADRLAAAFYDHPEANFVALVLPTPSCPAQLVIAGIDVTSNYKTLLIRAYTEPRYLEYLQRCFDCDNTVVDTIAWKALSISLRRIERACLCTKICNDLLPTARILYQWNQQGHDSCSLCGREETTTHMILCNHPSRLKLRRKYIKTLRARLHRVNTRAGLIDTFCSAISDWFDDSAVDPNKYPTQYHQAIQQQ